MAKSSPFPTAPDPAEEPIIEPDEAQTEVDSGQAPPPTKQHYGEVGISFKFGTGYEAPMLHFKADSLEGLADLTGYDREDETGPALLIGLVDYFADTEKYVTDTYNSKGIAPKSGGGSSSGGGGGRSGKPAAATEAPAWMGSAPFCKGHGEKTKYVSREKANGDRWHAWGCPRDKDDSCGLDFRNAPKNG